MSVQDALRVMDEQSWEEYLDDLRKLERRGHSPGAAVADFERDDCGQPLGHGMPSGASLRRDGESHRQAWARIVRSDPCAYCSRSAGTLDHIEPRSGPARGLGGIHSWVNYTGACARCNGSKGHEDMLGWLRRRGLR